jgi:hypothetical protein
MDIGAMLLLFLTGLGSCWVLTGRFLLFLSMVDGSVGRDLDGIGPDVFVPLDVGMGWDWGGTMGWGKMPSLIIFSVYTG